MAQDRTGIRSGIRSCLWFDDQAEEAARFYASVFSNVRMGEVSRYDEASSEASGRPVGSVLTIDFTIENHGFTALNGGPVFQPNPSISFIVSCATREEVDGRWAQLSDGGSPLMPLDSYPFSERYGWIRDRYGVSWQLILPGTEGDPRPAVVPSLLFVQENRGRAEEAIRLYTSIFEDSDVGAMLRYGPDQGPDEEGSIMYADFKLLGQWFAAMDSAQAHDFGFNEAISLVVDCETQEQVDHYWQKLSAAPEAEQCGWLKDRFGVSWQIVPTALPRLLGDPDRERAGRVMKAMLQMKKLDIAELEAAGRSSR